VRIVPVNNTSILGSNLAAEQLSIGKIEVCETLFAGSIPAPASLLSPRSLWNLYEGNVARDGEITPEN